MFHISSKSILAKYARTVLTGSLVSTMWISTSDLMVWIAMSTLSGRTG